uniref:Uncharacterized protein n=1 Tax=Opuntia streptacantha TaxID=393608 RepID=A0A7C9AYZ2_OPUST
MFSSSLFAFSCRRAILSTTKEYSASSISFSNSIPFEGIKLIRDVLLCLVLEIPLSSSSWKTSFNSTCCRSSATRLTSTSRFHCAVARDLARPAFVVSSLANRPRTSILVWLCFCFSSSAASIISIIVVCSSEASSAACLARSSSIFSKLCFSPSNLATRFSCSFMASAAFAAALAARICFLR